MVRAGSLWWETADRYVTQSPEVRLRSWWDFDAVNAVNVRAARNHEYTVPSSEVADGDEVAFFPPVTGG